MDSLARKQNHSLTVQEYGRVVDRENGIFLVETETGLQRAGRAFSCLVEPEINDYVLVSLNSLGQGYILAVLERSPGAKTTLSFEADVDLKSTHGRVGLVAGKSLDLLSENELNLLAPQLGITASDGKVNCQRLSFWGAFLEAKIEIVKLLADTFDSFLQRFQRRARYSFRQTEDLDQIKCGRLHYQADKSLQLRGEFSQLTAKEDVHIDGERINIG